MAGMPTSPAQSALFYKLGDDFWWRHIMTLHKEVVFVDFGLLVPLVSRR